MKKIFFLAIAVVFITSCQSDETKYEKKLIANIKELKSIKSIIDSEIDLKHIDKSRYSLNFSSDSITLHLGYFIYDSDLAKRMKELDIKEIRYDKTACSLKEDYDKMYFQLNANGYSQGKVIYFVFDSCGNIKNVKNDRIYQKSISQNWSLFIDSSYPNPIYFSL